MHALAVRLILSLALAFPQAVVKGPGKVAGPSLISAGVASGYSFIQAKGCTASAGNPTACTLTFGTATTSGNSIVVVGENASSNVYTVTDSASQSYTLVDSVSTNCPNTGTRCTPYYKVNSASITTVTCTTTPGPIATGCVAGEIHCPSTCAFDQGPTSNTSNVTPWTSNSITPSQANSIAIVMAVDRSHVSLGSITLGCSFTLPTNGEVQHADADIQMGYLVLSSGGSVNACGTATSGDTIISALINFK